MRRLVVAAATILVLVLGAVAGIAVARPETMPGALRVNAAVLPAESTAAAAAAITVTPLTADVGSLRVRGHAGPERPLELTSLSPGLYEVTVEAIGSSGDVVGLACSPAGSVSSVDGARALLTIEPGRQVDCTADVHERGEVVLRHRSKPASEKPVAYRVSFGSDVALAHDEATPPLTAPAGTHALTPRLPKGWDVSRAGCDNGSDPDAVVVEPGETVTCTVVATQRGRITVDVTTEPSDTEQTFRLKPSWSSAVRSAPGSTYSSTRLPPGDYRLGAPAPKGWDVSSATCDDASSVDDIRLGAGETIACAVTYTQRGRIVLASAPDAPTSAQLTAEPSWGDPVTIAGDGTVESRLLAPGTHSVVMDPPTGWALTDVACDDGSDPDAVDLGPGETVTCTFASTQPRFTVASFNVLGHSHTEPGGHSPGRPSGPARMQWTMDLLRGSAIDVVGLQEFQRPQMDAFVRLSGGEFALYPSQDSPQQNKQNAVAWRTSEFSLVEGRSVMMPYFKGNLVPMPLVRLRHNETGLEVYVMSVHNPASIRALGDQSRWRAAAKSQQIAFTRELLSQGIPFLMTGDMNERASYFCDYTATGQMHAAAGGSRGGACAPPPADRARIDWVFGSNDIEFSDYRLLTNGLVSSASDHPLVVAEALVLD